MRYILLLIFSLVFWHSAMAQDDELDKEVFINPVFVAPDPPKPIKGWEMSDYEGTNVLIGEYPGKILKFQFEGSAVGIEVVRDKNSGILEYSVDNYLWQKQDLFSAEEQVAYITLESDLKPRKHMLQIRLIKENNPSAEGNKCALKSFFFNAN